MELGWALLVPSTGARADVVLRVDAGALFSDVDAELQRQVVPVGAAGSWSVDGVEVDPRWPVGERPLQHGALLVLGAAAARAVADHLVVHVVAGPRAGQVLRLAYGQVVLGRDPALTCTLDDPRVSRAHCHLEIGAAGVIVGDLDSTNGTELDGVPVLSPTRWPAGAVLRLGDSRLVLAGPAPSAAPVTSTGDGRLSVNRPPHLRPDPRRVRVEVPHPPGEREPSAVPVLAVVVPLLLGVLVWQLTDNALFLLFTLLSPVMVLGSVVTERRRGTRLGRREQVQFTAQRTVAEQALRAAVRADELSRRRRWPDAATLLQAAGGPGGRLWERRRDDQDALDLRLGVGDLAALVDAEGDVRPAQTTARDVPVVVSLREVGVLGLCGPQAAGLARWAVAQAAVLHSPRDLRVVVLGPVERWRWVACLPHVAPGLQSCRALVGTDAAQAGDRVAELLAELDARQADRTQAEPSRVLLVVDGARLRAVPGLVRLLAEGPAVGIVVLWVDDDPLQLPGQCGAIARTGPLSGCSLTVSRDGHAVVRGTADLVDDGYADTVARSLAPLVDGSRADGDALPAQVRWTDLVGLPLRGDDQDSALVQARWAATARSTQAALGQGPAGAVVVDLVADGPHALVAGTTGSGKSELLQTLIASWALGNRPDELVMVLVDYKGGAAFGPCERLPHVVGLVTDLDSALVERALTSLHAELARRERLLRAAGVKDLAEHRLQAAPGEVLPRLVLVVDEFASLVEELPHFVAGLVGIAMRGRSLGVHLVLATQRPEGVVSADIRANTNLRICLAVTRDSESLDVVDSPLAARISRAAPGRAYVRTGPADLTAVQSARVGSRHPRRRRRAPGPTVELSPAGELGRPRVAQLVGDEHASTDLDLLVTACRDAAEHLQITPVRSPWLAPLPAVEVLPAGSPGSLLPFGLVDVPAQQTRRPLALDLDAGTHLLVIGSARSGRTTVLRTLAGSAAACSPDDLHLYALDLGGGLAPLDCLPHTGAVVGADEPARLARVLDWLGEQVTHRQRLLAGAGHADLREHRAAAPSGQRLPHLLLLLDRWEAFLAAFQDLDGGRLIDQVLRLLREGPAVGLHVVVTGDRSTLVGRLAAAVPQRLLLRLADPADYAMAGLPTRLVPDSLGPGRGWSLDAEPLVAQVALLDADPSGPAQVDALRRRAAAAPPARRAPHRIGRLPDSVRLADLAITAVSAREGGTALLGVGGDGPDPLHLDLSRSPGLVVAGPAGSGRSSTLLTLAAGTHGLRTVALAPRPSPLRQLPDCLTRPDDPQALQAAVGRGSVLLLVDDAELLVDSPVGLLLEELVRDARDRGVAVIAAGTTAEMSRGYRGFVVALRRARRGVLLCPESAADGDLLDVRLSRSTGGCVPPGRGLLVDRDLVQPVQVALP